MLRLLARFTLQLLSSALGLLLASLILSGFDVTLSGFVVSVLVFMGVNVLIEPLLIKVSLRYVPALRGGIALVAVFVSLLVTSLFTDGISIHGLQTWILAPLIVWLCVLLAGVILPLFMFKKVLGKTDRSQNSRPR